MTQRGADPPPGGMSHVGLPHMSLCALKWRHPPWNVTAATPRDVVTAAGVAEASQAAQQWRLRQSSAAVVGGHLMLPIHVKTTCTGRPQHHRLPLSCPCCHTARVVCRHQAYRRHVEEVAELFGSAALHCPLNVNGHFICQSSYLQLPL